MRVISQSPDPLARMHTMTKRQGKSGTIDVKALLREDEEFLRALVRTELQEGLEAEMREALGAEKSERRGSGCRGCHYRSVRCPATQLRGNWAPDRDLDQRSVGAIPRTQIRLPTLTIVAAVTVISSIAT